MILWFYFGVGSREIFLTKNAFAVTIQLTQLNDHSISRRKKLTTQETRQIKDVFWPQVLQHEHLGLGFPFRVSHTLVQLLSHRSSCFPQTRMSLSMKQLLPRAQWAAPCHHMKWLWFTLTAAANASIALNCIIPTSYQQKQIAERVQWEEQKPTRKRDLIKSFSLASLKRNIISNKYLLSTCLQVKFSVIHRLHTRSCQGN